MRIRLMAARDPAVGDIQSSIYIQSSKRGAEGTHRLVVTYADLQG